MYTLGIDVGSSSSKAAILEDGKKIVTHAVVEIGTGSTGPERVLDEVFKDTNLKIEDMANIIATGYGRFNVDCAKGEVSGSTHRSSQGSRRRRFQLLSHGRGDGRQGR